MAYRQVMPAAARTYVCVWLRGSAYALTVLTPSDSPRRVAVRVALTHALDHLTGPVPRARPGGRRLSQRPPCRSLCAAVAGPGNSDLVCQLTTICTVPRWVSHGGVGNCRRNPSLQR